MGAQFEQENRDPGSVGRPPLRPRRNGEAGAELSPVASPEPRPSGETGEGPAAGAAVQAAAPAGGEGTQAGPAGGPAAPPPPARAGEEPDGRRPAGGRRARRPLATLRWEDLTQELRDMHTVVQSLERRTGALVELAELARLVVTRPEEVVRGLRALAEQLEWSAPPADVQPAATASRESRAAGGGPDPLAELLRSPQVQRSLRRLLDPGT
ncbi:MAG: hypothetical protein K6U79_05845 [Firmicutes bacterium]|nr:hypothetical protein [Bacillota bacterium]